MNWILWLMTLSPSNCFFEGELAPAHVHCEYVVSRYDLNRHRDLAKAYSEEDPAVACSSFDAIILWLLGFPDSITWIRFKPV